MTSVLILKPSTLAYLTVLVMTILVSLAWSDMTINRKVPAMRSLRKMSWLMTSALLNGNYDNSRKLRRLWLPTSLLIFTLLSVYNGLFKTDLIDLVDTKVNSLEQLLNSKLKPSFFFAVTLASYREAKTRIHKRVWEKATKAKVRHLTYDDEGFNFVDRFIEVFENQVAIINQEQHNKVMLNAICDLSPEKNLWVSKQTFDAFLYSFPFSTTVDPKTKRRFDRWQVLNRSKYRYNNLSSI
ncbi:hypothetical protein HDE_01139 [Halotydeus destructor]|nr:hypothetical protein HDE_01139 [Halotydeus destructor]